MMKKLCSVVLSCMLLLGGTANVSASGAASGDGSSFAPENHISKAIKDAVSATKKEDKQIFAEVPILMFHHIDPAENSPLTPDSFKKYMEELKAGGYETVFLDDLIAFVDGKGTLPEKPVVVTFDDGYESNYVYAWPILKELGMKADISVIGLTVGSTIYPGTNVHITPHFTWQQAREMQDSGVIRIHAHSYQLHESSFVMKVDRMGVLRNPNEPYDSYTAMFRADTMKLNKLIEDNLRYENKVYAYPYGLSDKLTESLLSEMGYRVTLSIEPGVNFIEAGNKDSLKLLKRISCDKNGLNIIDLIKEQSLL